jgi:hypothetical protein
VTKINKPIVKKLLRKIIFCIAKGTNWYLETNNAANVRNMRAIPKKS